MLVEAPVEAKPITTSTSSLSPEPRIALDDTFVNRAAGMGEKLAEKLVTRKKRGVGVKPEGTA